MKPVFTKPTTARLLALTLAASPVLIGTKQALADTEPGLTISATQPTAFISQPFPNMLQNSASDAVLSESDFNSFASTAFANGGWFQLDNALTTNDATGDLVWLSDVELLISSPNESDNYSLSMGTVGRDMRIDGDLTNDPSNLVSVDLDLYAKRNLWVTADADLDLFEGQLSLDAENGSIVFEPGTASFLNFEARAGGSITLGDVLNDDEFRAESSLGSIQVGEVRSSYIEINAHGSFIAGNIDFADYITVTNTYLGDELDTYGIHTGSITYSGEEGQQQDGYFDASGPILIDGSIDVEYLSVYSGDAESSVTVTGDIVSTNGIEFSAADSVDLQGSTTASYVQLETSGPDSTIDTGAITAEQLSVQTQVGGDITIESIEVTGQAEFQGASGEGTGATSLTVNQDFIGSSELQFESLSIEVGGNLTSQGEYSGFQAGINLLEGQGFSVQGDLTSEYGVSLNTSGDISVGGMTDMSDNSLSATTSDGSITFGDINAGDIQLSIQSGTGSFELGNVSFASDFQMYGPEDDAEAVIGSITTTTEEAYVGLAAVNLTTDEVNLGNGTFQIQVHGHMEINGDLTAGQFVNESTNGSMTVHGETSLSSGYLNSYLGAVTFNGNVDVAGGFGASGHDSSGGENIADFYIQGNLTAGEDISIESRRDITIGGDVYTDSSFYASGVGMFMLGGQLDAQYDISIDSEFGAQVDGKITAVDSSVQINSNSGSIRTSDIESAGSVDVTGGVQGDSIEIGVIQAADYVTLTSNSDGITTGDIQAVGDVQITGAFETTALNLGSVNSSGSSASVQFVGKSLTVGDILLEDGSIWTDIEGHKQIDGSVQAYDFDSSLGNNGINSSMTVVGSFDVTEWASMTHYGDVQFLDNVSAGSFYSDARADPDSGEIESDLYIAGDVTLGYEFQAYHRNVTIDGGLEATNPSSDQAVVFSSGSGVFTLGGALNAGGPVDIQHELGISIGGDIDATDGYVTLRANAGTITAGSILGATQEINIEGGGEVQLGDVLTDDYLQIAASNGGDINVGQLGGMNGVDLSTTGDITAGDITSESGVWIYGRGISLGAVQDMSDITIVGSGDLLIDGDLTTESDYIAQLGTHTSGQETFNNVTIQGAVQAGELQLDADGDVVITGDLTISSSSQSSLNGASFTSGAIDAGDQGVTIETQGNITIHGGMQTGETLLQTSAGGKIFVDGSITSNDPSNAYVSLDSAGGDIEVTGDVEFEYFELYGKNATILGTLTALSPGNSGMYISIEDTATVNDLVGELTDLTLDQGKLTLLNATEVNIESIYINNGEFAVGQATLNSQTIDVQQGGAITGVQINTAQATLDLSGEISPQAGPDDLIAEMIVSGLTNLNETAIYRWDLSDPTAGQGIGYDFITFQDQVTLADGFTIAISLTDILLTGEFPDQLVSGASYDLSIAAFEGGLIGDLSNTTVIIDPGSASLASLDSYSLSLNESNQLQLNFQVSEVPEPSSLCLLSFSLLLLNRRRRSLVPRSY